MGPGRRPDHRRRWRCVDGVGDGPDVAGIGGELVDILARKTDRIVVLDMCDPIYKARNVRFFKCDITNVDAIAEVAKTIRREVGHPTIIVNNAGIAKGRKILELTSDEFLMTYRVNTLGCFHILKEFLPHSAPLVCRAC